MKKTDLLTVHDALDRLLPRITVPPGIARRARHAIDRMLVI
jgi:quinolinate synthase